MGFGIKENKGIVTLVYPIIACFLYIVWAQNDRHVGYLGNYIRERYEKAEDTIDYPYWEKNKVERNKRGGGGLLDRFRDTSLSGGGVFLSTQLIALLLGILGHYGCLGGEVGKSPPFSVFLVVLIISGISSFITFYLHITRPRREGEKRPFWIGKTKNDG